MNALSMRLVFNPKSQVTGGQSSMHNVMSRFRGSDSAPLGISRCHKDKDRPMGKYPHW